MRRQILKIVIPFIALLSLSCFVSAQEYTLVETIAEGRTGPAAEVSFDANLESDEMLQIYVKTDSYVPWDLAITRTSSGQKELPTIFPGQNEIKKEYTKPGYYAINLKTTLGDIGIGPPIPLVHVDTKFKIGYIDWYVSIKKYRKIGPGVGGPPPGRSMGPRASSEPRVRGPRPGPELDNAIDLWFSKGNALYSQKRYDEAIQAYDKALELDPKYAEVWDNKGNALGKQGKFDEAIQAFNKAIELNPTRAWRRTGIGIVLGEQGRYDEALEAFGRAIKLNPQYGVAWGAGGLALKSLGRYTEADAAYARARELGSI